MAVYKAHSMGAYTGLSADWHELRVFYQNKHSTYMQNSNSGMNTVLLVVVIIVLAIGAYFMFWRNTGTGGVDTSTPNTSGLNVDVQGSVSGGSNSEQ
jgi:flagellar biosynthesis/type III secretory pathway M-ring protein FliF/YscJ